LCQMPFEGLAVFFRFNVLLEKKSFSGFDLFLEIHHFCQLWAWIEQLARIDFLEEKSDVANACFLVELFRQLPFLFKP